MNESNDISDNLQNTVVFCKILVFVLLLYALENIEELIFFKLKQNIKII